MLNILHHYLFFNSNPFLNRLAIFIDILKINDNVMTDNETHLNYMVMWRFDCAHQEFFGGI